METSTDGKDTRTPQGACIAGNIRRKGQGTGKIQRQKTCRAFIWQGTGSWPWPVIASW
jgi:hypothetical protein